MTKWGIASYFILFISNNQKWIVYRAPEKHIFVRSHSNRHRLQLHYCILLPPRRGPPKPECAGTPKPKCAGGPTPGCASGPQTRVCLGAPEGVNRPLQLLKCLSGLTLIKCAL